MPAMRPPRSRHGFTLLEMAFVLAVIGIVMALAVPSYANFMARQQLRAAGESLALDLNHAREESLRGGPSIYITYRTGPDWCWGISRGQPCDCGLPASCNMSRAQAREYPRVTLAEGMPLQFESGLGRLVAAGSAAFSSSAGHSLQVQTTLLGRPHLCGPDAPKPSAC